MSRRCPSCLQEQVVTVYHTAEDREIPGYEMIPEEHETCVNCDWNTCGLD